MKLVVVYGNHGDLFTNAKTGEILKRQNPHKEQAHGGKNGTCLECRETAVNYSDIAQINLNDVTVPITWNVTVKDDEVIDIGYVDIARVGYTLNNGEYVEPSTIGLRS